LEVKELNQGDEEKVRGLATEPKVQCDLCMLPSIGVIFILRIGGLSKELNQGDEEKDWGFSD
jgi:hypothetical protein